MNFIKVSQDNIATEHICCAISNENDVQVFSKKAWLRERFQDGLTFLKAAEQRICSAAFNFTYAVNYFRCLKIAKEQFFWNPVIGENI